MVNNMERQKRSSYFDISAIISAKKRRRQALLELSWEDKIAIVDQMRQLLPKGMWKDKVSDEKCDISRLKGPTSI